jgi:hypothetical protein
MRGVRLPASMQLLGEPNWRLPERLHSLPTLRQEPERVALIAHG